MFKEMASIANAFKQAQGMAGKIEEMKERMSQIRVDGQAGGGMVTVEMNGQFKVINCRIDRNLIQSGDGEMIEELFVAATNQAVDRIRERQIEEMQKTAGGMNLPGLGDALSSMGLGGA